GGDHHGHPTLADLLLVAILAGATDSVRPADDGEHMPVLGQVAAVALQALPAMLVARGGLRDHIRQVEGGVAIRLRARAVFGGAHVAAVEATAVVDMAGHPGE